VLRQALEALVERAAGAAGGTSQGSQLPTVRLGGTTGHELATQLGTLLLFDRSGVSFVVAGSLPPATVEQAAKSLG
jgi:hypothetical protein